MKGRTAVLLSSFFRLSSFSLRTGLTARADAPRGGWRCEQPSTSGAGGLLLAAIGNTQLLHAAVEGRGINSQHGSRTSWSLDAPAGLLERLEDMVLLGGGERFWWRHSGVSIQKHRHSEHIPGSDDGTVFNNVPQFAHVSRPGVGLKRLHGLARHLGDLLAHPRGEFLEKSPDQHRDVLGPLTERRHADGKYVESVVEIFPEAPGAQILSQVTVGGRDDADVHLDGVGAAQALELAFLQDAQQLGLHVERQLANLIEEDRRTVRYLETSDLSRECPGEGALLAAEEFAFHQGRGERGAVDFDH